MRAAAWLCGKQKGCALESWGQGKGGLNHGPTGGILLTPGTTGKVCLRDYQESGSPLLLGHLVRGLSGGLPHKEVLYRSVRHPDFAFLTINVTGREPDPARVSTFLEKAGYTFPVLKDDGRKTYDAYGITSVPASVLIDREGNLAGIYDETVPLVTILQEIDRLLHQQDQK